MQQRGHACDAQRYATANVCALHRKKIKFVLSKIHLNLCYQKFKFVLLCVLEVYSRCNLRGPEHDAPFYAEPRLDCILRVCEEETMSHAYTCITLHLDIDTCRKYHHNPHAYQHISNSIITHKPEIVRAHQARALAHSSLKSQSPQLPSCSPIYTHIYACTHTKPEHRLTVPSSSLILIHIHIYIQAHQKLNNT